MIATTDLPRARAGGRASARSLSPRTPMGCLVCGCREVRTDEVLERGVLVLNECSRCSHRWTERLLAPAEDAHAGLETPAAA